MDRSCTAPEPRAVTVRQLRNGVWQDIDDVVSHEVPLSLAWEGGQTRLWAWPQHFDDLVLGHVLLDRLHDGPHDGPPRNGLPRGGKVLTEGERAFRVVLDPPPAAHKLCEPGHIDAATLLGAMAEFMGDTGLWDGTGCFHRAGVYDIASGKVLQRAEDIGRHNCLDRLAGWGAREGVDLSGLVLLVSARVTASLCAKALRAGFRFIVSRSAVTTASVDMALDGGVTLVGFARDRENRLTVFADTALRVRP